MSIWDKSKALGHVQLTNTFEQGRPFTILAMDKSAPVDLQNGLPPTSVALLTVRGAKNEDGPWEQYGETQTVSVISAPILAMVEEASPDDFPAVVCWEKVQVRTEGFNDATVLKFIAEKPKPEATKVK